MKKYALMALGAMPVFGALAEDSQTINLTAASTFLDSYTAAIKSFFTDTATITAISSVVGAFLSLWIIGLVVMIVKRLGNKSK